MDQVNTSTSTGADGGMDFNAVVNDAFDSTDTAEATEDTTDGGESTDGAEADATADDAGGETEAVEDAEAGDGDGQEPEADAEAQPTEEAKPADANDDYVVRERNGKKELVFKQGRGEMIYGTYKTAQEVERVFGEPLTPQAAEARHNAFIDQQALVNDLLSNDASAELNLLNNLAQMATAAREAGEIAHDPMVNLAARMPEFLRGNEAAYNALRQPVLQDALGQLKRMAFERIAANPQDDGLAVSIEHIENALFNRYQPRQEFLKPPDAVDSRLKAVEEREKRLAAQENQRKAAEWQDFNRAYVAEQDQTISAVLDEKLKDVLVAYEQFPDELAALKQVLTNEFKASLKNNAAWQTVLGESTRRAKMAASPSARETVKKDLIARIKANADYGLDPVRNERIRTILSRRAAQVKAESDSKHKRLAAAAAKREPGSTGTPVKQTIAGGLPKGISGAKDFARLVDSVLS